MRVLIILFLVVFSSCESSNQKLNGKEILEKSILKHDPNGKWNQAEFSFRVQEPRIQNPERFSVIYLNNRENSFKLLRNRGDKIASYAINSEGIKTVLLDNKSITDSLLIKKYLLQESRINIYKKSYTHMLGLPMTLNGKTIKSIDELTTSTFNNKKAYKLNIELKEPVFSKYWNTYISVDDFSFLGIELIDEKTNEVGEKLYFEKTINTNKMFLQRMKHWYDSEENYLGSDIIVKSLD